MTDIPLRQSYSGVRASRLLPALALVGILVLALALRLYRIDAQSFWYDEGTSVVLATRDLATISQGAAADIHPPLYYFILHYWEGLFGQSEAAVRSLSALMGVALVLLTWAIGKRLFGTLAALAGALLVAVSPVAIYYSQETRMYTQAAMFGAAAFLAMLAFIESSPRIAPTSVGPSSPRVAPTSVGSYLPLVLYTIAALAALYSHYFAFTIPLVANIVVALWALRYRRWRAVGAWVVAQIVVGALFLPWLLYTLDAIRRWPAVSAPFTLLFLLADSLRVFSLGRGTAWSPWGWAFAAALAVGAILAPLVLRRTPHPLPPLPHGARGKDSDAPSPQVGEGDGGWGIGEATLAAVLYLVVPLLMMYVLSLRKPMYNPKFLLLIAPPFSLLVAQGALLPLRVWRRAGGFVSVILLAGLLAISVWGLLGYYFDPRQARDDYRGIAHYLMAAGRPGDAIILNAPSQAEVFGLYYTGGLPVVPLPQRRPADRAETEAALAKLAADHGRIYGLFWATNESDPDGIVEGWLGRNGFKAMDSWVGNLRLTLYALPQLTGEWQTANATFGPDVTLDSVRLGDSVEAGDVLPVGLRWRANAAIPADYSVFVHLVDSSGAVIGQHDAPPGGAPTRGWTAGATRDDNHGILVPFGTPPGVASVEVGLYDPATGRRLTLPDGRDSLSLGQVTIQRPAAPPPLEVFNLSHRSGARVGDLTLAGYDVFKRGFDHAPDTPIHPGDEVQVTLYWQASKDAPTLPADPAQSGYRVAILDGATPIAAADAAPGTPGYPVAEWRSGEIVRSVHILQLPADLAPGRYSMQLDGPDGGWPTIPLVPLTVSP
ncbi:MAG: glycosyltransferase family 39 protein [Anaerolineae bacterium]